MGDKTGKKSVFNKILDWTEYFGNALPHPGTIFGGFALLVLIISFVGSSLGWQVEHPGDHSTVEVLNLLSKEGVRGILIGLVDNYTGFAPLGVVMVAMLGIGIAEQSGLINAIIRALVLKAPRHLLTFVVVFSGILSNVASDIGYVLLIPLAGVIFYAVGRHPIAGMAAAFAGVSGGFSANLVIGTVDPLLAGISTEAARIIDPGYDVSPLANYYFMFVSTFIIAGVGTWVTDSLVEPRLGQFDTANLDHDVKLDKLSPEEKKGLRFAALVGLIIFALLLWGLVPENGWFRGEDGGLLSSPLIKGVVALLFIVAAIVGLVYGFVTGEYKSDADVMNGMTSSMKTLASYLVLVFFAAQFVAFFRDSNLGIVLAVNGAEVLMAMDIGLVPMMILFVLFAAMINMVMGSASAKWAILAPVFIPMFMIMGYSPELSQVVYRIGDSVTNVISPMMSFFVLLITFFQRYDRKAGIGTIIATMAPYSFIFLVAWILLLVVWLLIGLPIGPGSPLEYRMG